MGLLSTLATSCEAFRLSLYADDAAFFIRPTEQDFLISNHILNIFAEASGLVTNLSKTEFYPIQCGNTDLEFLTSKNHALSTFPCKYLGPPLHFRKLTREMLQPVVQKVGNKLPGWKRGLLSYPERESLVKSVLSSMLTYFMTVFKMRKWAIARIDKFRRGFLWKGHELDNAHGGHCLVSWQIYTRPKKYGGLGIKDLEKFGKALRLRWLWFHWDTKERSWKHLLKIRDPIDRQLFFASTEIQVGDGKGTPFWEARWLHGAAPKDLAPNLYKIARFKSRLICT
jgi:hypothetical protein